MHDGTMPAGRRVAAGQPRRLRAVGADAQQPADRDLGRGRRVGRATTSRRSSSARWCARCATSSRSRTSSCCARCSTSITSRRSRRRATSARSTTSGTSPRIPTPTGAYCGVHRRHHEPRAGHVSVRGGIDYDYARTHLGRDCDANPRGPRIPIRHRNLKNHTTAGWKHDDNYLDWLGPDAGQGPLLRARRSTGTTEPRGPRPGARRVRSTSTATA